MGLFIDNFLPIELVLDTLDCLGIKENSEPLYLVKNDSIRVYLTYHFVVIDNKCGKLQIIEPRLLHH